MTEGRIDKALSGFYYVATAAGETLSCRARGKFRKEGLAPLVGDRVSVRELGNGEGYVEAILPRRNACRRPAVANIDQLVIVASGAIPVTDPFLIDRMCAVAALKDCGVVLLLNKHDLDPAEELYRIYTAAGFPTLRVSAETGEGIAELKELLSGKLSAFTGNSGVGKSSILNRLDPHFSLKVGEVSQALGRGRTRQPHPHGALHDLHRHLRGEACLRQDGVGRPLLLPQKAQQQMLRAHVAVAQLSRRLLAQPQGLLRSG